MMLLFVALCIVVVAAIAFLQPTGHPPMQIPGPAGPPALPGPPPPPPFAERQAAIGIEVRAVVPDEPSDIGRVFATAASSREYDRCSYCKASKEQDGYALYEIVRLPPTANARDLGLAKKQRLGTFCAKCGLTSKDEKTSELLGEAYARHENLLDMVEELERARSALPREKRKALLASKLETADAESARIRRELYALDPVEDPTTHPYRRADDGSVLH
jgi:hypothetical protein